MGDGLLRVGDSGEDVALLHDVLAHGGGEVPVEEVRRRLFGPGTRRAVQAWQRDHGLEPTGSVDEPTVALLAAAPRSTARAGPPSGSGDAVGVGMEPALPVVAPEGPQARPPGRRRSVGEGPIAGVPWTLTGRVLDGGGRPVAGARVRAFSVRLRSQELIGGAVTDGGGGYVVSGDRPLSVRVGVYDDDGTEIGASAVRFPSGPVEDVEVVLPGPGSCLGVRAEHIALGAGAGGHPTE